MPSCVFFENISIGEKDGCEGGLEAATVCYILCLFGQGNFIFMWGKSQGILHIDVSLWQP